MTCDSAASTASRSMRARNSSIFPMALLLAFAENFAYSAALAPPAVPMFSKYFE